ncbi:hypothetical protein [Actinophytocola sp.]|uniref:hypothetical protein n=1 Tax=Actinophytocola sp. TaxID=1872138 RepID=UPI002D8042D3|nr:hypothetical protein [Actinophytocola sp.]HET9139723.1 hypothetical protein [Actinophytocola sp.]
MTDDLDLPPRRKLPADVRDRIRATVLTGVGRRRSWPDRARPPLAAAASVAVLATGAVIVMQSVTGWPGGGPAPVPPTSSALVPPPLDPVAAAANLDRCWTALQQAGKAASAPPRESWTPVFEVSNFGRTVTAARAAGKPLFCETTRTTVTVTDPNAQPRHARGSTTAAMLVSADGGLGGVADPAWQSMMIVSVAPSGAAQHTETYVKGGLFVAFTDMATGTGSRATVRRIESGRPELPTFAGDTVSTPPAPGEPARGQSYPELDLPAPPAPLVSATDRAVPPPDQSDQGRFLAECLARSDTAVIDPRLWQAAAITEPGPYRAVLARSGQEVVTCSSVGNRTDRDNPDAVTPTYAFMPVPGQPRTADPIQVVTWAFIGVDRQEVLLGVLRADVTAMEVDGPDREPTPVPIQSGAFAVTVGWSPAAGSAPPELTVVLRNAAGAEVYAGPLQIR